MAIILASAPLALFTRPELSVERFTYDAITPTAAIGVLEAIYWKPSMRWAVDEIRVLNPIKYMSIKRNEVSMKASARRSFIDISKPESRMQRNSVLLKDVAYAIKAHIQLTGKTDDDKPVGVHWDIFTRRMKAGQLFRQPYLGCKEFACDVSLIETVPEPDPTLKGERNLGLMLHSLDYGTGRKRGFFRAIMRDGVIKVPRVPEFVENVEVVA